MTSPQAESIAWRSQAFLLAQQEATEEVQLKDREHRLTVLLGFS